MTEDLKHIECRIFNLYAHHTFFFDHDGTLFDCLEVQKVCKFLLSLDLDVRSLTSRISGLEDANFHNHQSLVEQENFVSEGFTIEEQWGDRYGVKYKDLDQHSDVYEIASKIGIDHNDVYFTEGCSKALHLKREGEFQYVLFDDSEDEIDYVKTLSPSEIAIKVDRGNKTYEDYIKELYRKGIQKN